MNSDNIIYSHVTVTSDKRVSDNCDSDHNGNDCSDSNDSDYRDGVQ